MSYRLSEFVNDLYYPAVVQVQFSLVHGIIIFPDYVRRLCHCSSRGELEGV